MKTGWMRMAVGVSAVVAIGVAAAGISLCDYRSPETAMSDASVSFTYRYFNDAATGDEVDVSAGRISLSYDTVADSPGVGYSLTGAGEIALDRFVPTSGQAQGAGTVRYYVHEDDPLFGFGGLDAAVSPGLISLDATFGFGYGRFNDVTPLARAMEIEAMLRDLGVISEGIGEDALISMAQMIGRQVEYDSVPVWVAEIELLLEGATGAELDARAVLHMEEILLQPGNGRRCGWAVQAGIGYELIDPTGGDRNLLIGLSANVALASTPAEQFVLRASFSGPMDITSENKLLLNMSYRYRYSANGTISASYVLQRMKPAGELPLQTQSASASVSLRLGGADTVLQLSLTQSPETPGWSVDVSVSAAVDLL